MRPDITAFVVITFSLFVSAAQAFEGPKGLSPLVPAGSTAASIIRLHETQQRSQSLQGQGGQKAKPTVLIEKKTWKEAKWSRVPVLKNQQSLQREFETVRDAWILKDERERSRRLTWLYPDDGCYARAEMASRYLKTKINPLETAKIFAFGQLMASTPNHPNGVVGWWYHVAPIVRMGVDYYVFDPSIEAKRPLKAQEWLNLMSAPDALISICTANAYDPGSLCETTRSSEQDARNDLESFMRLEWQRLIQLERSPEVELGNNPPWKS